MSLATGFALVPRTTVLATGIAISPVPSPAIPSWSKSLETLAPSYVTPILEAAGPYRMAGTPAWCALNGYTDPVNVAALFDAAQH